MYGKITGREYGRIASLKGMGRLRKFSGKNFECVGTGYDPDDFENVRKKYKYVRVTKTGIDEPYECWVANK